MGSPIFHSVQKEACLPGLQLGDCSQELHKHSARQMVLLPHQALEQLFHRLPAAPPL